jgi:hypothetical protein
MKIEEKNFESKNEADKYQRSFLIEYASEKCYAESKMKEEKNGTYTVTTMKEYTIKFNDDPEKYANGLETSEGIESMSEEQYNIFVKAKKATIADLKKRKIISRTTQEEMLEKIASQENYAKKLREKEDVIKNNEEKKEQEWQENLKKFEEINAEKNRKQQEDQEAKRQENVKKIAETHEFISNAIKEHGENRVRADLEDTLVGNKSNVEAVIKGERSLKDDELKTLKNYLPKAQEEPKKEKKYVQQEIDGMKKRGGWRGGGRPKSTGQTTIAVRIDKRLEKLVDTLKKELKNGTLNENKIKNLIENVQENTQKLPKNYDESINFDAEMERLDAPYKDVTRCYAEQKDSTRCKKQHKTIIETENSDILLCATHEKAYKNGTLKIHRTAIN